MVICGLRAVIVDSKGEAITSESSCYCDDSDLCREMDMKLAGGVVEKDGAWTMPIVVEGERLGWVELTEEVAGDVGGSVKDDNSSSRANEIKLTYLLADTISRLCSQETVLERRIIEMTTLSRLSRMLAGMRDLQEVLDAVTKSVTEVLGAKAASIRLLNDDHTELLPVAAYNLSQKYLDKGPILVEKSLVDVEALGDELVYVEDMATDSRIMYPEDAKREGIGSILITSMAYRGALVGVTRVYTSGHHEFSEYERGLFQAMAQLSAGAIENVRLRAIRQEARRIQRQVELAADVQRRLMPGEVGKFGPFDIAARYEPCFELSGDFFDLIEMDGTLGVMVGDVVGKGIAASLLMSSVRASLRAHVEDVYDIGEVMSKANVALSRDTQDNEFATVFYGVLDCENFRMTYCSAGHEPAFLLRGSEFVMLETGGMVLGVDSHQEYSRGVVDLERGDVLLIYTDGVPDAMNFDGERFGRQRIMEAMREKGDEDAKAIINHVLWEIRRFIGMNTPSDDLTLLVVKV